MEERGIHQTELARPRAVAAIVSMSDLLHQQRVGASELAAAAAEALAALAPLWEAATHLSNPLP